MFCPRSAVLNPGAAPAVLSQPHRKHPSAQRFVHRPFLAAREARHLGRWQAADSFSNLPKWVFRADLENSVRFRRVWPNA